MATRGLLITFEGPEGSGKSTHILRLAEFLRRSRRKVILTREPGGSRLSADFRQLLLHRGEGLSALAELLVYEADRAQHMVDVIEPALRKGVIILCDRFTDSTVAYQGYGRGLSIPDIHTLNALATGNRKPDLTILLDVDARRGLAQAHAKKKGHDRLERAGLAFHERVRRGFLALAKAEPKRFRVIRQQEDPDDTQRLIRDAVDAFL